MSLLNIGSFAVEATWFAVVIGLVVLLRPSKWSNNVTRVLACIGTVALFMHMLFTVCFDLYVTGGCTINLLLVINAIFGVISLAGLIGLFIALEII